MKTKNVLMILGLAALGTVSARAACTTDKPPADAEVLFDVTSLERWRNMNGGPASWHIQPDGTLLVDKTGNTPGKVVASIYTRDIYTNFQMHVEYRIPVDIDRSDRFRGNSGVKVFGCYEVQIIDGFENPDLKPTQMCAAIYSNAAPLTNACTAPGTWQSLDIVFKAPVLRPGQPPCRATITVKHNDVLVQDATRPPPFPENPETLKRTCGTIELQSHNDNSKCISFRNVWIRRFTDIQIDAATAAMRAKKRRP